MVSTTNDSRWKRLSSFCLNVVRRVDKEWVCHQNRANYHGYIIVIRAFYSILFRYVLLKTGDSSVFFFRSYWQNLPDASQSPKRVFVATLEWKAKKSVTQVCWGPRTRTRAAMKIVNYVLLQDAQTKILPVVLAVISCLRVPNAARKIMRLARNPPRVLAKKPNVLKVNLCWMAQAVLSAVNAKRANVFRTAKRKVYNLVCAIRNKMPVCGVADRISIRLVFQSWTSKAIRTPWKMVHLVTKDLVTK